MFDIGGWVYGMLSVPPDVVIYLGGGGGAAVASAMGASATSGVETPHKLTFTWLERPRHSQPLKPKCPTSRRSPPSWPNKSLDCHGPGHG